MKVFIDFKLFKDFNCLKCLSGGWGIVRTIEIDEEVYRHIAQNTHEIGEPATKILRRLLKLDRPSQLVVSGPNEDHELAQALRDASFRGSVCHKMLHILAVAHQQKGQDFQKVLAIQGRGRKYFALSEEEIVASGKSTQPRQVPGSRYWVMTNSPTRQKKEMLREVLTLLGFSPAAVRAAEDAID